MGKPLRLLVVEDSEDDTLLMINELRRAGFDTVHERVDRAETMRSALDRQTWDCVVSDYSMPHFRGDAALKLLRERDQDMPFVFVSGTIGEEAAVDAMRTGANDYVIKGNRRRLVPVIERELRDADLRREKKNAESSLRESEARYRGLFENAIHGIYRSDSETRFLTVNPALVKMLGYSSAREVLALDMAREVYVRPETRDRILRETASGRRLTGVEAEWKRKDGRIITVLLSGTRARPARTNGHPADPQPDNREIEIIAEDITERRMLEQEVGVLQKLDAIGHLAGGIAHDFNNVIGVIQGWAEVALQATPEGSQQRKPLEIILQHSRLAADLPRQLLAFARNQPLVPRNIDLNETVSAVLTLLERALGKNISLTTHLAPGANVVLADCNQVQQVLMNLCLNARDAMPNGGSLTISTSTVHIDNLSAAPKGDVRPGDYVMLSVTDTGTGIEPAILNRIFEPFFTTKEVGKGTGLGLATVFGIVKQHNGFIHVESQVGHGTTFDLYWPAGVGAPEPLAPIAHAAVARGTETLLLAEDHEGLRELFQEILSQMGYTVLAAKNGEEAVARFKENMKEISLLILDVTMPKLTGPEAFERIAKIRPGIPVIFSTGYGGELQILQDMIAKGAAVIHKPYTRQALAEKIRSILDGHKPN